jgi:hypothetical protein
MGPTSDFLRRVVFARPFGIAEEAIVEIGGVRLVS